MRGEKMRLAIVGYGNLGKACESIICQNGLIENSSNFQLIGIFTRRNPQEVISPYGTPVYPLRDAEKFCGKIDVMLLCVGSANDLIDAALPLAKHFNTVDCYDNHTHIPDYAEKLNAVALENGKTCIFSTGWDPGIFSLMRALFESVCNRGTTTTFWGRGVSQGHSEAIRKLKGVKYAIQYTVPKQSALEMARAGKGEGLSARDKHLRECYVVPDKDADKRQIEMQIKTMPDYFAPYDTTVHFIDEQEFLLNHKTMQHGGFVLRTSRQTDKECGNIECSKNDFDNTKFSKVESLVSSAAPINDGKTPNNNVKAHPIKDVKANPINDVETLNSNVKMNPINDVKMEFSLNLQSNPHFTASVMIAYAKAVLKLHEEGKYGAYSVLDVPMSKLIDGEWLDKIKKYI